MTQPTAPTGTRRRRRQTGQPGTPCPSCNKFCSLSDPEIESQEFTIDGDELSGNVTIVRNSECCGDEIKRADLEGSLTIDHTDCANADLIGREIYHDGDSFVIEEGYGDVDGELEGYTAGGGRYAAMKVGASGSLTATCQVCGEEISIDIPEGTFETNAGDMEVSV